MKAEPKKYSLFYRVYRRIRYLRYLRKHRKSMRRKLMLEEKQAERDRKQLMREKARSDRVSDRQKARIEKEEYRKADEEIKRQFEKGVEENADFINAQLEEQKQLIEKEKAFQRYRRKRLFRFYRKLCWKNTLKNIYLLNPVNLPKLLRYIIKQRQSTREFFIIALHSTLLFVAAYLMIFLIGLLTASISGLFFDYKSIIYHYEVLWLVKPEQWFGDSVKTIYASPPVLIGLLALFMAIIYTYLRANKGFAKLFILWSVIHGFNGFFGSLLIGSVFGKGFGFAIIWSYVSDTEKVIYSIVSITALFLIGIFTTRSFLLTANTYYPKLESKQQRKFVWAQVILPFIFGSLVIGAIMSPEMLLYDLSVLLCLGIPVITIALGYHFYPSLYFEDEAIKIKPAYRAIVFAVAFILLYRIVLGYGIPMG